MTTLTILLATAGVVGGGESPDASTLSPSKDEWT